MKLSGSVDNNPVRRVASRAKVMEDVFWEERRVWRCQGIHTKRGHYSPENRTTPPLPSPTSLLLRRTLSLTPGFAIAELSRGESESRGKWMPLSP